MNVIVHCESTRAVGVPLCIAPVQVDVSNSFAGPVFAHSIVIVEHPK